MLNVVMLMLSGTFIIVVLSVIILNVVLLNVVARLQGGRRLHFASLQCSSHSKQWFRVFWSKTI
jgi:hypothetical protein